MQKVMLISNAHARAVSARAREVIAKALSADFKLEMVDTAARSHASELARDAVDRDFEAVFAFGGDGTINEVAQGLIGTNVALGILPGGSTNVMARSLGMPVDPVEATAFVASRLRSRTSRRIPVGRVGDRYFVFSAGMGLDAEVVRRVEQNPHAKRSYGEWLWVKNALVAGITEYRGAGPAITVTVGDDEPRRAVTVVSANARPFTYFKRFPVEVTPRARMDAGLDLVGFARLRGVTIPALVWSLFASHRHVTWRSVFYHHDIERATLEADRPMPVQVDGDYIGHWRRADLDQRRDALELLV
jgi:diacylglycerol kinase family enzyme